MNNGAEVIRGIVGKGGCLSMACIVEAVDGFLCDVQPVDGDIAAIKGVRLNASGVSGLVVTPKIGSVVLVVMLGANDGFVGMFSEVEKVEFIDESGFEMVVEKGNIEINGGENGGIIKLKELESNLKSLKNFVESMHQTIPDALTAIGASSAASGEVGSAAYELAMTGKKIEIKDMENKKIKH